MLRAEPCLLDSTVLSNFACTESLHVLWEVLDYPATVPAVFWELTNAINEYPFLQSVLVAVQGPLDQLQPSDQTISLRERFVQHVDPGEAGVLAMAKQRDGLAITDDSDARTLAKKQNIQLAGSLGILTIAIEDDVISLNTADCWHRTWVDEYDSSRP